MKIKTFLSKLDRRNGAVWIEVVDTDNYTIWQGAKRNFPKELLSYDILEFSILDMGSIEIMIENYEEDIL